jgi:hypothetical protein
MRSLLTRIVKLGSTITIVNLSYGGDFSLCVASIATHFNVPLVIVLSLRDRFEASRSTQGINMEQLLINLITGALGGAAVGKSSPTFDLGTIGNIIAGLVGGGVLGQIVTLLLPSVVAAAESGNLSIGGIISQVIAGGAGGVILTAIIGAIKNKAAA